MVTIRRIDEYIDPAKPEYPARIGRLAKSCPETGLTPVFAASDGTDDSSF
jgi:hypothetical protein